MENISTYFKVSEQLEMKITEVDNYYGFKADELFEIATRKNPKRSFLFVSKLLGKHLAVHPNIPRLAGYLLTKYYADKNNIKNNIHKSDLVSFVKNPNLRDIDGIFKEKIDTEENTLVIGFAETATGLGHSVFSSLKNATFAHTTREDIEELKSVFDFEETHSHATSHRCYLEDSKLKESKEVFLVDDEMTTGNTALNLIKAMDENYPGKKYKVFVLLDWRNKEQRENYVDFTKKTGIDVEVISIYSGEINIIKEQLLSGDVSETSFDSDYFCGNSLKMHFNDFKVQMLKTDKDYLSLTGRFGLETKDDKSDEVAMHIANQINHIKRGQRSLVLGSGEFIYLPSLIAKYMDNVKGFKTYTRSPILTRESNKYPIHKMISFKDDNEVMNHIYNIDNRYDEVVLIFEDEISNKLKHKLSKIIKAQGVENILLVELVA